jgi:hypothetical protein
MAMSVPANLTLRNLVLACSASLGAITVLLIVPARADAPCPAPGAPLNTVMEASANGQGNRVINPGMAIYNDKISCGRVSSLIVRSPDLTDFVEVGWFEDPSPNDYICIPTTSGPPRELAFAGLDGMNDCLGNPANIQEGTDSFSVDDLNQDGRWSLLHKKSTIWTGPSMGSFNSGIIRNNGERLSSGDPARSDFNGLQRADKLGVWQDWQNPSENFSVSDDPDFYGCVITSIHTDVRRNATPCP